MNWKLWLKGLISAAISSASSVVAVMIADPTSFNLETGLRRVLTVATITAIVGIANYLKQSPVPNGGV